MTVAATSKLHENKSGSTAPSTSVVVALAGAETTDGGGTTSLIAVIAGATQGMTAPAGFVLDRDIQAQTGNALYRTQWYRLPGVASGLSSWTFTAAASADYAFYVVEIDGLDLNGPIDAVAGASPGPGGGMTNGDTRSTGVSTFSGSSNTYALAAVSTEAVIAGSALGSWSGWTNGFTEVADVGSTEASAVNFGVAAAELFTAAGTGGTVETTATWAAGGSNTSGWGGMVVYRAADSPLLAPQVFCTGYEFGTHNGWNGGDTGKPRIADVVGTGTWGTHWFVQAGSARNGGYGLRIHAVANAPFHGINTNTFGADAAVMVSAFSFRPQSASAEVVIGELVCGASFARLVWNPSTSKLGAKWDTGTVSYQSGTTPTGTWAWVEMRASGIGGSTWHLDWSCEESGAEVAQASPADLTGKTAATVTVARAGGNLNQTYDADFDDWCLSVVYAAYPLGIHRVAGCKVDTAATPTSSGTVGNFALLTNNATGAALTSGTLTSARDGIDELPPTISASSDGVLQKTTDTASYVQFPMEVPSRAADEIVSAVRMVACMVSTTGAGVGSLGIKGWDGTAETTLLPGDQVWTVTPGSATTVSVTVPPWIAYIWNPSGGWTSAKISTPWALRIGYSTDATPDMGVHAVYLEVAISRVKTVRLYDFEGGRFTVDQSYNPNSIAPVSYLVTVPPEQGGSLSYTLLGTPTSTYVPAGSAPQTVAVSAAAYADVSDVQFYPDPTP